MTPDFPTRRPVDRAASDGAAVDRANAHGADSHGADPHGMDGHGAEARGATADRAPAEVTRVDVAPDATPLAERTLPRMLERQAERFGDRPCLDIAGAHWRHADAAIEAARVGAALKAAGIGRGDRVALMGGNRVETLAVFLGCGWIGAVSVPINTASMGPQLGYFLADSGARLLVMEAPFV